MSGKGRSGVGPTGSQDRELWRRSQSIEAQPDEAERFLDLAAFAEHRLDDDEAARVAALIAQDGDATADVAAARALAGVAVPAADELVVARAAALVAEQALESEITAVAQVIAFPARRQVVRRPWFSAARWSGLAAAIAVASWLGFDLGSGLYNFGAPPRSADDVSANELLDPAPMLLRDFTDNSQI
jgi:hypothetical protein